MPYQSNDELPSSVKDAISSKEGQTLFREVVNERLDAGKSEEVAFASAWAALKNAGYEKEDGKWMKKRQIDDDVFTTEREAQARSQDLGFGGEIHVYEKEDGQRVYMPGPSHEAYMQGSSPEEEMPEAEIPLPGGGSVEVEAEDQSKVMAVVRAIMDTVLGKRRDHEDNQYTISLANLSKDQLDSLEEMIGVHKNYTASADIAKVDEEKRLVSGWASVIEKEGEPVVDLQGDVISEEEMMKAAHKFVSDYRASKAMHKGGSIGQVVDSIAFTKEQQEALGVDLGKVGWYITVKVDDEEAWKKVKSGEFSGFSIGGKAKRNPINE